MTDNKGMKKVRQVGSFTSETLSDIRHMDAFRLAYEKFQERNATYQDLWEQDTIPGIAGLMRSKLMRVAQLEDAPHADRLDDAVDLVNYSLFLLRHVLGESDAV